VFLLWGASPIGLFWWLMRGGCTPQVFHSTIVCIRQASDDGTSESGSSPAGSSAENHCTETLDYDDVEVDKHGFPIIAPQSDSSFDDIHAPGLVEIGEYGFPVIKPVSSDEDQEPAPETRQDVKKRRRLEVKLSNCSLGDSPAQPSPGSDADDERLASSSESDWFGTPDPKKKNPVLSKSSKKAMPPSSLADIEALAKKAQAKALNPLPASKSLKPTKTSEGSGVRVGESVSFGTVKLCNFSKKSYILRFDPEQKKWPSLLNFSSMPNHAKVSGYVFSYILDKSTDSAAIKCLRDRIVQDI
jgi:hypothetical protein